MPYRPATPPSEISSPAQDSPEFLPGRDMGDIDFGDNENDDDNDNDNDDSLATDRIAPKKGGYDSRVEQWLYENPDTPILITHAGKNVEGGGNWITYTIATGVGGLCARERVELKTLYRAWKCSAGTPNSPRCAQRWSTCTPPSSYHPYRRNIRCQTMLRSLHGQRRIKA